MATTIQNFFTRAAEKQFSRDFLFRVRQIDLIGGVSFNGDEDLVYARTAQLPGRATYQGADGYAIEFYHDEDCELRTKFEAASRAVFNNETSIGQYGMPGDESVINLVQIDKELNDVRNIELVGASIRDIGDIGYSIADGNGEVVNFEVTFAYHFYRDFS